MTSYLNTFAVLGSRSQREKERGRETEYLVQINDVGAIRSTCCANSFLLMAKTKRNPPALSLSIFRMLLKRVL